MPFLQQMLAQIQFAQAEGALRSAVQSAALDSNLNTSPQLGTNY